MTLRRSLLSLSAPIALLALGACAQPFEAQVSRFQVMPPPQGQSFVVQAANPRNRGGLEFSQYAGFVAEQLRQKGYTQAPDARAATFVVNLDYGVDNGQQKVVTTPGFGGYGFGPYGGGFGGYGGFGYGGFRRGFGGFGYGYGWNDPFFFGPEVNSYTFYTSHLDMTINRTADGQRLFEGRAKARSRTDSLPALVPNLVEALFTGFPGRSGEEVRITVAPPPKGSAAPGAPGV